MSRFVMNRRTLLRGLLAGGATVTVGLPLLEAMLNSNGTALAGGNPIPQRFMTWFWGNGVRLNRFVPSTTGQGDAWSLSEELAPLANVKNYVSVLTGFDNKCEKIITHHEGMTIFNGYTFTQQVGLFSKAGGPTIDQVIASKIGAATPIESVQVGVSKRLSTMDSGTTMHNLSHKGTEQPLPPEFNPQKVWMNLFGSFNPDTKAGPLRVAVLDVVRDQTASIKKRLGQKDIERLDAHLEGVDALQKKIEAIPPPCNKPDMPAETNADVAGNEPMTSVNTAMVDLLAYAFSCDFTRVASLLHHGGAANTVFKEIGYSSIHHMNTHDGSQSTQDNQVHNGIVYIMGQFAYLLEKFMGTTDASGQNLLENTIVFAASDCAEGLTHSVKKQPMIIAGRGGGYLQYPGIHYASSNGRNPSDVLLTMLQAFDPAATSVGAGAPMSTTPFTELKA